MNIQYIYLLQEREFIRLNETIYKLGKTTQPNHTRFKQYPKNSILLLQLICNDCNHTEKELIKLFKDKFIQRTDIGTEYFEGNYKEMIRYITDIINLECISTNIINISDDEISNSISDIEESDCDIDTIEYIKSYQDEAFKIVCKNIQYTFPNYTEDITFGGNKKLIIIKLIDGNYNLYYINPDLKSYVFTLDGDIYDNDYAMVICEDQIIFDWEAECYAFNRLLDKQIIKIDTIYDLKSKSFVDQILKTKLKINIENYHNFKTTNEIYPYIPYQAYQDYKRIELFRCNMIINNEIYVSIDEKIFTNIKKLKNFEDVNINRCCVINKNKLKNTSIHLYKINNKYYDYYFLRTYTPYCIRWDINKNYYIVNRDYEYINLNCKSIEYEQEGSSYVFNDGNKPWDDKHNFIRFCNEYKRIINDNSLKECINTNYFTTMILSLLN
jgi:hypothetical protein